MNSDAASLGLLEEAHERCMQQQSMRIWEYSLVLFWEYKMVLWDGACSVLCQRTMVNS